MDARKRKREATACNSPEVDSADIATLASLPDELIVQIFRHMDSVSRKRIERVCWRWKSLLRDTTSLRDHIKIDLTLNFKPKVDADDEDTDLSELVKRLLAENPSARLLHFMAPSIPYKLVNPVPELQFEEYYSSGDVVLETVGPIIKAHGASDIQPRMHVVLENVVMEMDWTMNHMDLFRIACLEFRNVVFQAVSLKPLVEYACYRLTDFVGKMVERERRLNGSIQFKDEDHTGVVTLLALLGKDDVPLTSDEQRQFRRVMAAVELDRMSGAAEALEDIMKCVKGIEMDRKDVVTGSAMTSFVKRLMVGGKDVLDFVDLHSESMESDNEPDDEPNDALNGDIVE